MKSREWKAIKIAVILAAVVGMVTATAAKADVVYTTFGTSICGGDATCIANDGINQNYDAVDGVTNTITPFETEMIADSFTPTSNFTLSDVKLVLQNLGRGNADIYLTADSGDTPGAVLESWLNQAGEPFALTQLNAVTLASVSTPTLTAGSRYWLVVAPTASNTAMGYNYSWNVDISGSSQLVDATPNGSGFATLATAPGNWLADGPGLEAAFQIDGTPGGGGGGGSVPEPSSLGSFGIGALGLLVMASRRKRSAGTEG